MIATLVLDQNLRAKIAGEARAAAPRECCGLIEGVLQDHEARTTAVHPVRNLATAPDRFEIDPAEHIRLLRQARERRRAIIGCYHSHPNGRPEPSPYDRENASDDEFIWLIASLGNDAEDLRAYVCNAGVSRRGPAQQAVVSSFRAVATATTLAAAGALLLPSVTHFADYGLSFALIFTWFALLVFGLIRHRPAAWWLLLTVPIALFWPAVIVAAVASGDFYLGF